MSNIVDTTAKKRTAIYAVIYGVIGIITSAMGIALLVSGYDYVLGIALILAGISGFGLSCFARPWLFVKGKDTQ